MTEIPENEQRSLVIVSIVRALDVWGGEIIEAFLLQRKMNLGYALPPITLRYTMNRWNPDGFTALCPEVEFIIDHDHLVGFELTFRGNWESNGRETPLFTFDNGQPMPLKPGNTWVQVVPLEYMLDIDGIAQSIDGIAASEQNETPTKEAPEEPTPTLTPIGSRP